MAGIELDEDDQPVIIDGKPNWIRPVCNTEHGEIPTHVAIPYDLLDIIEIDVIEHQPVDYQSENVSFNQNTIRKVGTFGRNHLANLCDNRSAVFGNKGKAISSDSIHELDHSLVLLNINQFNVFEKIYPDRPGKPQIRISFDYHGTLYDLPITDPFFRDQFVLDKNILKGVDQIYICVSLGIPWEGWYYKLVAGII